MFWNDKKILFFLIILYLIGLGNLFPQNISVNAKIDTNNVLIGDQIKLWLQAKSDKKTSIIFPQIPDTLGKFDVISRSKFDTLLENNSITIKQNLVITSFDSGSHELPALTFMYEKDGFESMFPINTNPIYVNFNTVSVDTTKPFKDIKGPMDYPFSILDYLPHILIGLLILGLLYLGYYYYKKYKKSKVKTELKYDLKIPAHIAALDALRILENEKLWQNGNIKLYHIRLTEIVRLYIERQFSISALEMISEDIITSLKNKNINSNLISNLYEIFRIADLAKFAKFQPLPDENAKTMSYSIDFVNNTIPQENQNEGVK